MIKTIKDIAKITTGYYAKTHSNGDVFYLQARDFDKYKGLSPNLEPNISGSDSLVKHYLNKGDVLFAAKGFDNFAATYAGGVEPAVASSIFIVLRGIDDSIILPEYLTWFINQPSSQLHLKRISKGSSLPSINKQGIGDFEIVIPDMKIQKMVMEIGKLRDSEKQYVEEIQKLKDIVINHQLLEVLNR